MTQALGTWGSVAVKQIAIRTLSEEAFPLFDMDALEVYGALLFTSQQPSTFLKVEE